MQAHRINGALYQLLVELTGQIEKVMMEMSEIGTAEMASEVPATLLCVDDEANILSALKRLFRTEGYKVLTAQGGAAGLAILEEQPVDIVISDMRMPEMDGAEFLAQVASRWPEIPRLLLTGFSDISSTVAAINKGNIYRYISKPWEENDLKLAVHGALEKKFLERERQRLEELTRQQNEELKGLNANLEAKVKARTEEIQQTADMLDLAYQELKQSYKQSIPVFASLIEMREGKAAGHSRWVAEHAREVAEALGMAEDDVEDVYFAGLLHDIGKIGLPDRLLETPFLALTKEERRVVAKHPVTGQMALLAIESLQGAAKFIRHHHERFEGNGFPDGIAGDAIPLGARVLTVVNDYDALCRGTLTEDQLNEDQAREFLRRNKGTRYDPKIVDAFVECLHIRANKDMTSEEYSVMSNGLRPGMVLSRDLTNDEGILLLASGYELNDKLITRIHNLEVEEGQSFVLFVKVPEGDADE